MSWIYWTDLRIAVSWHVSICQRCLLKEFRIFGSMNYGGKVILIVCKFRREGFKGFGEKM